MIIKTLIIGYVPAKNIDNLKPAQLRNEQYFKDFLAKYDLEKLHFTNYDNYKKDLDSLNPLVVITFGSYYAKQISEYKKGVFIYVVNDAGSIFRRKAEKEKKEEENKRKFEEAEQLIKRLRGTKDKKEEQEIRKVAGMGYKEKYDMLIQAIISNNENLQKKAWKLLTSNNVHSDFIWMRAQLLYEVWNHCDGKRKEEFLCMAMNQHIENGIARKLSDFTDNDGQVYHQYMFCFFNGSDTNYIRRIPKGFKGQDKYIYQAILEKYETPNGMQMMLEAGQMKAKKEEYCQGEDERNETR